MILHFHSEISNSTKSLQSFTICRMLDVVGNLDWRLGRAPDRFVFRCFKLTSGSACPSGRLAYGSRLAYTQNWKLGSCVTREGGRRRRRKPGSPESRLVRNIPPPLFNQCTIVSIPSVKLPCTSGCSASKQCLLMPCAAIPGRVRPRSL